MPWPEPGLGLEAAQRLADLLGTAGIDLLLVGTGRTTVLASAEFRRALRERGIASECMDSGAAARTFNVLANEGRRVAAALTALD